MWAAGASFFYKWSLGNGGNINFGKIGRLGTAPSELNFGICFISIKSLMFVFHVTEMGLTETYL